MTNTRQLMFNILLSQTLWLLFHHNKNERTELEIHREFLDREAPTPAEWDGHTCVCVCVFVYESECVFVYESECLCMSQSVCVCVKSHYPPFIDQHLQVNPPF